MQLLLLLLLLLMVVVCCWVMMNQMQASNVTRSVCWVRVRFVFFYKKKNAISGLIAIPIMRPIHYYYYRRYFFYYYCSTFIMVHTDQSE